MNKNVQRSFADGASTRIRGRQAQTTSLSHMRSSQETCRVLFRRWRTKWLMISAIVSCGIFFYVTLGRRWSIGPIIRDPLLSAFAQAYGQNARAVESPSKNFEEYSWYADVETPELKHAQLIAPKKFSRNHRFVYVVPSRVQSRKLRDIVRRTWVQDVRRFGDGAVVFLLGFDQPYQEATQDEADVYDDIVQYDFVESYANLTRKSTMMLKWASENLSENSILIKADNDMLVDVSSLRKTLQILSQVTPKFIAGRLIKKEAPIRDRTHRWFVSEDDYIGDLYPPYLSGGTYAITGNLIASMYQASRTTKLMPMEDVYITGMLPEKLHLIRVGLNGISYYGDAALCELHSQLSSHVFDAEDVLEDYYHFLRTTVRICGFWFVGVGCWCEPSVEAIVSDSTILMLKA